MRHNPKDVLQKNVWDSKGKTPTKKGKTKIIYHMIFQVKNFSQRTEALRPRNIKLN